MLQREQIIRGKEHRPPKCVVRPPFSLFTCLATTYQRLVTSPRDPGVVSSHVSSHVSHFSSTARRVTSPTWGPPPPCKKALKVITGIRRKTRENACERVIACRTGVIFLRIQANKGESEASAKRELRARRGSLKISPVPIPLFKLFRPKRKKTLND